MSANRSPSCPSFETLSQAFSEGVPELVATHVTACASCRELWIEFETMKATAQLLPWDNASPEAVAASKAQLLLAARYVKPDPGPWRAVSAASIAMALAASALLVLRSPADTTAPAATPPVAVDPIVRDEGALPSARPEARVRRAKLNAASGAKVEHYTRQDLEGAEREELVRVSEGTLHVALEPLGASERFLLITIDAELESQAAEFEVQVEDHHLQSVWVASGAVEVRPHEGIPKLLRTGDRWSAAPTSEKPTAAAPGTTAPIDGEPEVVSPPTPTEASVSAPSGEVLFTLGFDAFERGEHRTAEQHFGRLLEDDGDHPLAEDAAYWRALALAKLDDPEAESALAKFITSSGSAERVERSSLILGLRQLARGAQAEAIENLRRAEASSAGEIRERAKTALAGIERP